MAISVRVTHITEASLDIVGATASVVCAVHCAGVALLLGIAPVLDIVAQPWVDWLFLGASTIVGLLALVPGYRRHRHAMPLVLFSGGIAILFMARLLRMPPSMFELSIVLVAASALITAHWRNRGELRSCRCIVASATTTLPRA